MIADKEVYHKIQQMSTLIPQKKSHITPPSTLPHLPNPAQTRYNTRMKKTIVTPIQKRIYLTLVAAVFVLLLWMLKAYLWPFLVALMVYLALDKPYAKLHDSLGKAGRFAPFLMTLIVLIGIFVPIGFLLGATANEAIELSQDVGDKITLEEVSNYLESDNFVTNTLDRFNYDITELDDQLLDFLRNSSSSIFDGIKNTALSGFSAIINFFFMIIFLYFLFKDGEKLKERFYKAMPFPDELEKRLIERMARVTKDVFYGNIIITILQGAAVGIIFAIFSLPSPILLGSLAGFLSLVPVVGTFVVWIPAAIYLFFQGSFVSGIILTAWCLFAGIALDSFVKPKILDKKLNLHPILIFFALLGGLSVFGVFGIILGPLVAVLFIALWEVVRDWQEIKKEFNLVEEK